MKVIFTPYICILFFLLKLSVTNAQKYNLSITSKYENEQPIIKNITYLNLHSSEESIRIELKKFLKNLEILGYLNTVLDSVFIKDTTHTAYLSLNKQLKEIKIYYKHDSLHNTIVSKRILEQFSTKITDKYFEIPFVKISESLQSIVNYYETNGNSFTQVSLKNIRLKNESAIAELYIEDTRSRTIDKVIVKGYKDFPKNYIRYNLNLKPNTVFNSSKLLSVSAAINHLPFVEEQKAPSVLFTKDSTFIYLYLKKKQSNRFDGVLGFTSKDEGGGVEFNGYLDFLLNNVFNNGEAISLLWKNNGNSSQRFYISAEIPYIFNLPIIPKSTFEIFRQDTTYSNTNFSFQLSYLLNSKSKITAVYNSEKSNNLLKENLSNSNITTFQNIFFGATYSFLLYNNDVLFPEKMRIDFSTYLGNRKSMAIKTNQSKIKLFASYLYSLNFKHYLFIQSQSALLVSENYLDNELFRIGGVNSIRGVNEESIFASSYSIINLEYRLKVSSSNYLFSITDFAYVNNDYSNINKQIFSLGVGYAFITKMGIFNLSYAIGKFNNEDFNFNESKLHIKLISVF